MSYTTYKITLSDRSTIQKKAQSAAEAMQWALDKNRGLTVVRCYSGMTADEAAAHNRLLKPDQREHSLAMAGLIEHEIPAHRAIPPKPEKGDVPAKQADIPLGQGS